MASRASGKSFTASNGKLLTQLEHELTGSEGYVRIEVENTQGQQAWTNPQAV